MALRCAVKKPRGRWKALFGVFSFFLPALMHSSSMIMFLAQSTDGTMLLVSRVYSEFHRVFVIEISPKGRRHRVPDV